MPFLRNTQIIIYSYKYRTHTNRKPILVPRLALVPSDISLAFKIQKQQFLIKLTSINKPY